MVDVGNTTDKQLQFTYQPEMAAFGAGMASNLPSKS
jgi:hypothetical protein